MNVDKYRKQIMKKISSKTNQTKAKNYEKKVGEVIEEIKAFYEGDLLKMDEVQKDKNEPRSDVCWHEWDMVMVFPNPDYGDPECSSMDMYIDDADDAKDIYKQCFKKLYRESPAEQNDLRAKEIEMVKDLINKFLQKDEGILNIGGGRFKKYDPSDHTLNGRNHDHSNGDFTADDDTDVYYDTKVYCADFSTLIMNAIIYRLNKVLGFETILLMSKTGKELYLCIRASQGDLKKHAQNQSHMLTLEIGYSDILSLEPCDALLNPLSKVEAPDVEFEPGKVITIRETINELEFEIMKSMKAIDEKNKKYKLGDDELNNNIAEEIDGQDIYVNTKIKEEAWRNYIKFLEIVKATLERGLENFNFDGFRAGVFISETYRAAIRYVNEGVKEPAHRLYNLWNRLEYSDPVRASSSYVRKINSFGLDEFDKLWYRYIVDEDSNRSIFSNSDKFKIMDKAIQEQFLIEHLVEHGYIKAYFPLHDEFELTGWCRVKDPNPNILRQNLRYCMGEEVFETIDKDQQFLIPAWNITIWNIFKPPVHIIRKYYGEKIAYYFDFVGLYSRITTLTVPVGTLLVVLYFILDNDHPAMKAFYIIFAICNVTSCTIFVEYLKRREKSLAAEWGQLHLTSGDIIRPLFKGVLRRSPINDDLHDLWTERLARICRYSLSYFLFFICTCFALGGSALLLWGKYELAKKWEGDEKVQSVVFIFSVANALAILILDIIFRPIILYLTKLENLKTKRGFENSYVLKSFMFKAANNYGSLIYIAFAKGEHTGCIYPDNNDQKEDNTCIWELTWQLILIFGAYMLQNVFEVIVPIIRMRREGSGVINEQSIQGKSDEAILKMKIQTEYGKTSYDEGELNGVVDEYMELCVQFGYCALFSIAFSAIPLIAVLNNCVEMMVDKNKLLYYKRRPIQRGARSNGLFTLIFEVLAFWAIFTNLGIACFTTEAFDDDNRFIIFLWLNVAIYIFRFLLQEIIPDERENTFNIRMRHNFVIERTLARFKRFESNEQHSEKTNFTIMNTIQESKMKEMDQEESYEFDADGENVKDDEE